MTGIILAVPCALLGLHYHWIPGDNWAAVAVISLLPFAGIILLSLAVNIFRAPAKLDHHRGTRIDFLRKSSKQRVTQILKQHAEEIEKLRPIRTASYQYNFDIAKAVLAKLGLPGKITIRHLWTHGSLTFSPSMLTPTPEDMSIPETERMLLAATELVTSFPREIQSGSGSGTYARAPVMGRVYQIAPAMKEVLEELLFSEDSED